MILMISWLKQSLKFAKSLFLYRLLWARNFHYKHNPKLIDVGWNRVQTYGTFRCPIRFLRASIATEKGNILMKIEQTPYYHYIRNIVTGDIASSTREVYRQYLKAFFPRIIWEEEVEKIERLVESIICDTDFGYNSDIVTYPPKRIKGTSTYEVRIYDGVRRACIANAMGYRHIQCRIR